MNQDLTLSLKDVLPELMEETSNDAGDDSVGDDNSSTDISCSYPSDKDMEQYLKDEARHWDHRVLKRYTLNELPFEMMVAYPHPIYKDIFIAAAADMPHCCKKQVNAMELSGKKKSKRDLHLDGLPIQLRMGYDPYKQSNALNYFGHAPLQLPSLVDFVRECDFRLAFSQVGHLLKYGPHRQLSQRLFVLWLLVLVHHLRLHLDYPYNASA